VQLEREINFQKLKLASDILLLKEKEVDESQICACRSFYRNQPAKTLFRDFEL
jgi:hypothetical protein